MPDSYHFQVYQLIRDGVSDMHLKINLHYSRKSRVIMQVYYIIIKKCAIHSYFAVIPEINIVTIINIKQSSNP